MTRTNNIVQNPSETRSAELFVKGLKCVSSLRYLSTLDQTNFIDSAIGYFNAAIEEDEFNELALLYAATWKSRKGFRVEEWVPHYRKAKAVALTELSNRNPDQVKIAEQAIKCISVAAPADMLRAGQGQIYLEEFSEFCLKNAALSDLDKVKMYTCGAMLVGSNLLEDATSIANEVARHQGWNFVVTALMLIEGVAQSRNFGEMLGVVLAKLERSERECADAVLGIFSD